MLILVTGGAGFIGSHTCVELLNSGYDVVVVDNFSNSKPQVLQRIKDITGKSIKLYPIDIRDDYALEKVFKENKIQAVIHFAGLKAVGESVTNPLKYYENNVSGTGVLCKIMTKYQVKNIVFSSSATVYGEDNPSPLTEDMPISAINPYGRTKIIIEEMLKDIYVSDNSWGITILRYFNPIGAHESGKLGEDPNGVPNNLMPYITQVAIGKRQCLNIFGNDYNTPDGTGVRDYIHVVDLAKGHIKAMRKTLAEHGVNIYNLGTGKGYSVLQVIRNFEKVTGKKVPYKFVSRRHGDSPCSFANSTKAFRELGWVAEKTIQDMCLDSFRWEEYSKRI